MADFNKLALTTSGIKALLAAQAGETLTLTKIGMGSGSTNNFTSLGNLVTPEVMLPISEKRIDEDSGFMSIVAKMTNKDITEGFYWRETGLFFEDEEGNDVLFAYACVVDDQYDYVPAYSDKRYVKHVRIANILTDSANITIKENEGLLYVDTLTFEEYKEFVAERFEKVEARPVNNNLLINSNFANPVNQRGQTSLGTGKNEYWIDRWKKYANLSATIGNGYIEITRHSEQSVAFLQTVEDLLLGKTVTFSVKLFGIDNPLSLTATVPKNYNTENFVDFAYSKFINDVQLGLQQQKNGSLSVMIIPRIGKTIRVEWAKLELGNFATPYVAKLYAEEYLLCQRYYQNLPMLDAKLYAVGVDALHFAKSFIVKMRDTPTVVNGNVKVLVNGNEKNGEGFEFLGVLQRDDYYIIVQMVKARHGLSEGTALGISGRLYLDAEL